MGVGTETNLQTAVATFGPVSVAIDAQKNLMNYKSGIFLLRKLISYDL